MTYVKKIQIFLQLLIQEYLSSDLGNSLGTKKQWIYCIKYFITFNYGSYLFVGKTYPMPLYSSIDNGNNWIAASIGLPIDSNGYYYQLKAIVSAGSFLCVGTMGGGISISSDTGQSWSSINNGLTNLNVTALSVSGNNIFAGTQNGFFVSTDFGNHWHAENNGLTHLQISAMCTDSNFIYVGTDMHLVFKSSINSLMTNISEVENEFQEIKIYKPTYK